MVTRRHARSDAPPAHVKADMDDIRWFKRYYLEQTFCGIYFLFDGSACVYVGQSNNVHARVQNHKTQGLKTFDSYTWMPCDPGDLGYWENHYIAKFNPRDNRAGVIRRSNMIDDRMTNLLKTMPLSDL